VRLATVNEWTVLTVALLWAFFSVLACGEWARRRYTGAAIVFLLLALASGGALAAAWRDQTAGTAVVVAKEAAVRRGPLDESQAQFQLRDGAELTVLSTKDDWIEVRDAERRTGWIRRDEILLLPNLKT
jgi:hypothetical protein